MREMLLPVYHKKVNQKEFTMERIWRISRGWYDDGEHQYMVEFEPVGQISSWNRHYYRFHLFGGENTFYRWLILNWWDNFRFLCLQNGCLKTIGRALVFPLIELIKIVQSLF